jgi:hypothetical protein
MSTLLTSAAILQLVLADVADRLGLWHWEELQGVVPLDDAGAALRDMMLPQVNSSSNSCVGGGTVSGEGGGGGGGGGGDGTGGGTVGGGDGTGGAVSAQGSHRQAGGSRTPRNQQHTALQSNKQHGRVPLALEPPQLQLSLTQAGTQRQRLHGPMPPLRQPYHTQSGAASAGMSESDAAATAHEGATGSLGAAVAATGSAGRPLGRQRHHQRQVAQEQRQLAPPAFAGAFGAAAALQGRSIGSTVASLATAAASRHHMPQADNALLHAYLSGGGGSCTRHDGLPASAAAGPSGAAAAVRGPSVQHKHASNSDGDGDSGGSGMSDVYGTVTSIFSTARSHAGDSSSTGVMPQPSAGLSWGDEVQPGLSHTAAAAVAGAAVDHEHHHHHQQQQHSAAAHSSGRVAALLESLSAAQLLVHDDSSRAALDGCLLALQQAATATAGSAGRTATTGSAGRTATAGGGDQVPAPPVLPSPPAQAAQQSGLRTVHRGMVCLPESALTVAQPMALPQQKVPQSSNAGRAATAAATAAVSDAASLSDGSSGTLLHAGSLTVRELLHLLQAAMSFSSADDLASLPVSSLLSAHGLGRTNVGQD